MADQPSPNGSQYGASIVNNRGTVVIGPDTSLVQHTNGYGAPAPRDPSPSGSQPAFSVEDELKIVNKVSKFIKKDYSNKYAKVNRNPMKEQQTPLQRVFLEPNLELIDCSCETEKNCTIYDVFKANNVDQSPTRVLLYGQAFMGKSILCQKYVHDWVGNSPPGFPSFKIVVLLKLRDAKGTLKECLERELFCDRLNEDEKAKFFSYMKRHPEQFLFLLDGIDECNLEELPDIKNLLLDKVYRGVYLIATILPELNFKLLEMSKGFHRRYRITGYGEDSVLKFVSKYFQHDDTKRETLNQFLEINSDLMALPWTPLVTLVICEFWEHRTDKSLTMTKLLRCYIDEVLELFRNWKSLQEGVTLRDVFSSHQYLASSGVMKEQEEFTQDTLNYYKVDPRVGFLCADLKCKSYKFAHEKLQEYFAAREKVENWNMEELKRSLSTLPASVLVFIAGLLAEKKDHRLLQFLEMLTISMSKTFFQDSCFCNTMDLFLACVAEAWNVQTSDAILGLCTGFEPFRGTKTSSGFPLQMSHGAAHGLGLIVRELAVPKLNLNAIVISPSEAKIIASKCLEGNSVLTSVKFSHSCLSSGEVKTVSDACASMVRLEEVDLSCSHFGDEGLYAIANLIQQGKCGIKSLQLANNLDTKSLKREKVQSAKHKLAKQSSLTTIGEFQEKGKTFLPGEQAILALIEAIQTEGGEIKDISLPSCVVANAINQWLDVFRTDCQLQRIKLHLKEFNETIQDDIKEVANNMPELEQMSLVVEDDESCRTDFVNHHSLAEETGSKIKLTFSDHTHSCKFLPKLLHLGQMNE